MNEIAPGAPALAVLDMVAVVPAEFADRALKFDRCAQAKHSGVGNATRGRIERIKRAAGGVKDILEIRLNEKAGDNLGLIGKLEGHLIVADGQGGRRKERRISVASTRCRRDPVVRKPPPQKCRPAVDPRGP